MRAPLTSEVILPIVQAAAEQYRGAIPADCWHEPYMSEAQLRAEMAAGVSFLGHEAEGRVVGVMGVQRVRNVHLIRHAYVLPEFQGRGIGSELLQRLRRTASPPILIGTWAAATWAVSFYERNGFSRVPESATAPLLRAYWTIPERQIVASVVLTDPALTLEEALELAS